MSAETTLALVASMQAEMYAAVTRVEGMKALNQWREMRGESQAYDEEAFATVERTLEYLSVALREVARG